MRVLFVTFDSHIKRNKKMKITKGMIVWLKTGSPAMTVNSEQNPNSNQWICQWFVGAKANHGTFGGDSLTDKNPQPTGGIVTGIYDDKD